mgnify:CR=1 FL=1
MTGIESKIDELKTIIDRFETRIKTLEYFRMGVIKENYKSVIEEIQTENTRILKLIDSMKENLRYTNQELAKRMSTFKEELHEKLGEIISPNLEKAKEEMKSKLKKELEAEIKAQISKFRDGLFNVYKERVGDLESAYDIVSRLGRRSTKCQGEQCVAQFDKYSESDKSSSSEWDTFLSNKQEEISKKLVSIGFDIIPEDIKSSLIHLFKSRGINGMDDITDITLIEDIISRYISNLTIAFAPQGEGSATTGGGGKHRKKYSKKKKKSKKKKGKSKRKRSKTRRRR